MNKKEYQELKKTFAEVNKALTEENLSAEERKKFETLKAQLAGTLLSPWLPVDWIRRVIMMIMLAIVGIIGLVESDYFLMLFWLLLPIFSPRFIGELTASFQK